MENLVKNLIAAVIQATILQSIMNSMSSTPAGIAYSAGAGAASSIFGGGNTGAVISSTGELIRANMGYRVPGPDINRDIIPALVTPGERILNRQENAAYEDAQRGNGGGGGQTTIYINAMDSKSFEEFLRRNPDALASGYRHARRVRA